MSEWVEKKLSAVVEIISGGTPRTDIPDYWNGNIYWLAVNDFSGDMRWVHKSEKTISNEGLQNSATKILNAGDIIVSARGTVGELAQIGTPMAFNQSCYGLRGKAGYYNDFLYYAIKQQLKQIKGIANGAVFDTIILKTFDHIKLSIPNTSTQTRIAEILSAYDDLIENNNRRIALLEKAARELYNEWFVRFRFPGYKKAKFINGLPEGWEIKYLGDIVSFSNGRIRPETDGIIPVYGGNGILAYCNDSNQSDGIIIGRVGAYCGSVYYESRPHWVSDNAIAVKNNIENTIHFVYHLLKQLRLNQRQIGTGQPLLTQDLLRKIRIILPPNKLIIDFSEITKRLSDFCKNLKSQSQNLARQRDLLLPRLMSGKLEV